MTDEMSNVIQLFPNPTDEGYEGHILPALVIVLGNITDALEGGDKTISPVISPSLLRYASTSLINLELMRRDGVFRGNMLPPDVGWAVDQLAADCALSLGGDEEMIEQLRHRTPVRGKPV